MLPFSAAFKKVHQRTQTPIIALLIFGAINVAFTIFGYTQKNSFDTLVGATAIIPFIIYFMITVAYAYKRKALESIPGAFNLGRYAKPVITAVLLWTLAMILALSLPSSFRLADAIVVGSTLLSLAWYLLVLKKRISRGDAGVRPIEEYPLAGSQ